MPWGSQAPFSFDKSFEFCYNENKPYSLRTKNKLF